jgi:vacuolar-type H+-ATPase subunit E/Vma4
MALADLVARLEQDAAKEVQAIAERADAEVLALRTASDRAIAEASARHLDAQRAARQAVRRQELTAARQRARAAELEARHALLARILARARALVPEAAESAAYRAALPAHLAEALSYGDGLRLRVRCQAALAPILGAIADRRGDAELVVDESTGPGVIVEAADGSVTIDNTLSRRLARIEPALAVELLPEVTHAGE